MTWIPRSDWLNVKDCQKITSSPNAIGDGKADDTAALQGVLDYVQKLGGSRTIYFPPGTYKITSTLKIGDVVAVNFYGCGSKTIISYAGPTGAAMIRISATEHMIYEGLTWEGNNLAAAAYEHASQRVYETNIRHENESFRNITAPATYSYFDQNANTITQPTPPTSAIITGFPAITGGGLTGETMIYNCAFHHCTIGVVQAWHVGNNFMWHVDNCQFEDCGYGIRFFNSGCNDVDNCHFERSTICDVMGGHSMHVRHCTSQGSARFYDNPGDCPVSPDILENCVVDHWSDITGVVHFDIPGPNEIFDCIFTHPPPNAGPPINVQPFHKLPPQLITSNNREDNNTDQITLINKIESNVLVIPPGKRGAQLTNPTQTFLHTAYPPDSTHIIDVTQAPYLADTTFKKDSAPAMQAAVDAARKANNGSVVYLPAGFYLIGSTINVAGSNYTVEGQGYGAMLCWTGAPNSTVFSVTDPHKIKVAQFRIAVPPGGNVACVHETATRRSDASYEEINNTGYNPSNPNASTGATHEPGVVLEGLPTGSRVFIPHMDSPLTVKNCGPALVFAKFLQVGETRVSGTAPDTGYTGIQVLEGGQQDMAGWNIIVGDNLSMAIGDYYSEQCGNDLRLDRGAGTGAGHVCVGGFLSQSGLNNGTGASTISIGVNDYQGRLCYNASSIANNNCSIPVRIELTGKNPFDLVMLSNLYSPANTPPAIKNGFNDRVIQAQNVILLPEPGVLLPETPNPLTPEAKQAIARSFDDFRELEAVDLSVEDGIGSGK